MDKDKILEQVAMVFREELDEPALELSYTCVIIFFVIPHIVPEYVSDSIFLPYLCFYFLWEMLFLDDKKLFIL